MNPYEAILNDYRDSNDNVVTEAIVVLLKVMRDAYVGGATGNPYRYALAQLKPFWPSRFLDEIASSWAARAIK